MTASIDTARSGIATRSAAIDAVRIVAVVAIVAGHAWSQPVTADWVYPWHVPVFLILSGYLWKPGRTLRSELAGRWSSLGRPYVAWFALLSLALLGMAMVSDEPVGARLLGGLYGGAAAVLPYTTLWFIGALFFTALLFRVMERWPRWLQWMVALAGAAAGYLWGVELVYLPLGIGHAAFCLVYVLVGDTFRQMRSSIPLPLVTGVLLIVAGVILVGSGASAPLDMKLGDNGTPLVSIITATSISIGLVLVAESTIRPGNLSRVITLLAVPLLAVVLAHPVFLWLPGPPWMKFVAGLCIPLAIGLASLWTPLAPWITGSRHRFSSKR